MTYRYTPWWLPLALIISLLVSVGLFSALVVSHGQKKHTSVQSAAEKELNIYQWRLITTWPKNLPGLGSAPENFAKLIKKMSNNRLNITVYGANEIVPALGVFDAVSAGSVEMGHGAAYYWKGKVPASAFFTALPFGLNAQEFNGWLHYGGGMELWRAIYKPFNLIPFAGGNTGVQMGGWFNKEIHSVADLKGLKMRIPGYGGEVFTRAGGTSVNIPGGELYTALQTGVIDATEWVGPYNDLAFGFHRIAKYYYAPGWHEPGPGLEFIVNQSAFDRLPEDLKIMVKVAARAVNQDMLDEYTVRNVSALKELLEIHKVEVREFPKSVLAHLKAISFDVYEQTAKSNADFATVYRSYKAYLNNVTDYHKLTEQAYYKSR